MGRRHTPFSPARSARVTPAARIRRRGCRRGRWPAGWTSAWCRPVRSTV